MTKAKAVKTAVKPVVIRKENKPKFGRMIADQYVNEEGVLVTLCKPGKCRGSKTFSTEYR